MYQTVRVSYFRTKLTKHNLPCYGYVACTNLLVIVDSGKHPRSSVRMNHCGCPVPEPECTMRLQVAVTIHQRERNSNPLITTLSMQRRLVTIWAPGLACVRLVWSKLGVLV